ncbi:MAG: methyltransferase [Deferrisomatales bacterium]|nr:methyltransferase [Deferrisomatales bacterium]
MAGYTQDGAFGGAVTLVQPRDGYRFSLDALLLARFAAETQVSAVLDLGCGCGVVGLGVLALGGAERLEGVDIQEEMVRCARESARRSDLGARVTFQVADYREGLGAMVGDGFPLVVSNPPYRPPESGRVSPRPGVAVARHEVCGTVSDLTRAAAQALQSRGSFCVVYPAARLPALLGACAGSGLQPSSLRCVHPRAGQPASLVLLRCAKGGGGGLEVRAPLVLHGEGDEKYTPEAATLLGLP